MNDIIFSTQTGAVQRFPGGYIIDGKLGEVESPLVLLTETHSEPPEHDAKTQQAFSSKRANLETGEWETVWEVTERPPQPLPDAEMHQVQEWLLDQGIPLASIPTIIKKIIPEGVARDKALMRWDKVNRVPASSPLMRGVAAQLGVTVEEVWPEILAIV